MKDRNENLEKANTTLKEKLRRSSKCLMIKNKNL